MCISKVPVGGPSYSPSQSILSSSISWRCNSRCLHTVYNLSMYRYFPWKGFCSDNRASNTGQYLNSLYQSVKSLSFKLCRVFLVKSYCDMLYGVVWHLPLSCVFGCVMIERTFRFHQKFCLRGKKRLWLNVFTVV